MTEPLLSKIDGLIDDFVTKTGDSPTHILVAPNQWEALGSPKTYEYSVSCCLDYTVVEMMGTYHFPELPMVVQLPQFFHKPIVIKDPVIFKLGKYKVTHEA